MKDAEWLVDAYLDDALDPATEAGLVDWLMQDADHMRRFTGALRFDHEIRDTVHARASVEAADRFAAPSVVPFRPVSPPARLLTRAAAWLGGAVWFGNKSIATAATTPTSILMTKATTTAITAAVVIAGSGSVYLIHRKNQETSERISALRSGIESRRAPTSDREAEASPRDAARANPKAPGAAELLRKWRRLHEVGPADMAEARAYMTDLNAMEADGLRELLLEAERMGDLPAKLVQDILLRLTKKSPADATPIGVRLVNQAPKFNRNWADYVGQAFRRWLEQDPSAAHEWYVRASESGELTPKSVPPSIQDRWSPDRLLAGIQLAALLETNPTEAEEMMAQMRPEDVAMGINDLKDPDLIARVASRLPAENQFMATYATAERMAGSDLGQASDWIASLEVDASTRDKLSISALSIAQEMQKLDLEDVVRSLESLPISDEGLPELLLRAATNASLVPRKGWQWDTMGERTAWLRKNLPAEQAEPTVGRFLGTLARSDIDEAMKIYEQETRGTTPDPRLSAEFAKGISEWGNDKAIGKALRIVEAMPEGPLREETKTAVEKNRR